MGNLYHLGFYKKNNIRTGNLDKIITFVLSNTDLLYRLLCTSVYDTS